MAKQEAKIVKDALRRFPGLPLQTIAHNILNTYGDLFDNDLEKIRSRVRYYTGTLGNLHRGAVKNKSLFRDSVTKLPETWRKIRTSYTLPKGLWLVLSDLHIPFHEPLPIERAIEYGQAVKVTGILLNGDFQDCASMSYWGSFKRDFNKEIMAVIDTLDFLRHEFPTQKIVYKPGNHEYRLPAAFLAKMPDLAETPLVAWETILGFEQREIEFLDYNQIVMAGDLPIIHGHEVKHISNAVNPARGLFLKTKTFSACSHCHSTSEHTPKTIFGELLTTWSFGCLCDLTPDWNPYGNNWNWGFAIVSVEDKGFFEVTNRRILDSGKVV